MGKVEAQRAARDRKKGKREIDKSKQEGRDCTTYLGSMLSPIINAALCVSGENTKFV